MAAITREFIFVLLVLGATYCFHSGASADEYNEFNAALDRNGDLDEFNAALDHNDYATALKLIIPIAEQGNLYAQNIVGKWYEGGWGAPQDYQEAVNWYRRAAEQKYADAEFALGRMYENGLGITEDESEAINWYLRAANQNHRDAQFQLSQLYCKGSYGLGQAWVPETPDADYVQAHMWANIAAAQGSLEARKMRDEIARRMTKQEIDEAQRMAREWVAAHPQ